MLNFSLHRTGNICRTRKEREVLCKRWNNNLERLGEGKEDG